MSIEVVMMVVASMVIGVSMSMLLMSSMLVTMVVVAMVLMTAVVVMVGRTRVGLLMFHRCAYPSIARTSAGAEAAEIVLLPIKRRPLT